MWSWWLTGIPCPSWGMCEDGVCAFTPCMCAVGIIFARYVFLLLTVGERRLVALHTAFGGLVCLSVQRHIA